MKQKTKADLERDVAQLTANNEHQARLIEGNLKLDEVQRKELSVVLGFTEATDRDTHIALYNGRPKTVWPLSWPQIYAELGKLLAKNTQLQKYAQIDDATMKAEQALNIATSIKSRIPGLDNPPMGGFPGYMP